MKRFEFSLETLLKLREREEEQSQMKLAEAIAAFKKVEISLQELQNRYEKSLIEQGQIIGRNILVHELMNYVVYQEKLQIQIEQTKQKLLEAQLAQENERINYLNAAKRRKIVEKLKARKLQQYWQNLLKEEQDLMDELGTIVFLKDRHVSK